MANEQLKVINHNRLGQAALQAELIQIPGKGNYKPNMGVMPNGDLIMFTVHQHQEDLSLGGSYSMHTVMFRSTDGGMTWSRGMHMRFMGHEPSVTVIDGIIFVLTHFLSNEEHTYDALSDEDYTYDIIYRSEDGGGTWMEIPLRYEQFPGAVKSNMAYSRNILKLKGKNNPGRLLLGMTVGTEDYACYSDDMGVTWKNHKAAIRGYRYKGNYEWGVFGESLFFYSPSGRLMMLSRMDLAYAEFIKPLPFAQRMDNETGIDHFDGEVLFESMDSGMTWDPVRAVGFPALMYPGIVMLSDNRFLLNYTVREVPPEGSGAAYPHIGVQAVLAEEKADGSFAFSMDRDVIIIDDHTKDGLTSGGGFGRTVMLSDGTLVTPYSYLWADDDVMDMVEKREYLDPAIFDKYGSMLVNPIKYENSKKSNEMLRMSFAVIWAFHGLMNKAGIRTNVVRWKLPESLK